MCACPEVDIWVLPVQHSPAHMMHSPAHTMHSLVNHNKCYQERIKRPRVEAHVWHNVVMVYAHNTSHLRVRMCCCLCFFT